MSSIWKTVCRCLNSHASSKILYSGDPLEVANAFNEYFVSVGGTVATKAKQLTINHSYPSFLPGSRQFTKAFSCPTP